MIKRMMIVAVACAALLCAQADAWQQTWGGDAMMRAGSRGGGYVTPTNGFITTWVVANGGSITLPLRAGYTYNMQVDYGDGTVVNVNSNTDPDRIHQYTSGNSNRTVVVTGSMGAWDFYDVATSKGVFTGVVEWNPITGFSAAGLQGGFWQCAAATNFSGSLASGWTNVTDIQGCWYGCSGVKNGFPYIGNLTNMTTLYRAWQGCSGNTNGFPEVSSLTKVTDIRDSWSGCSAESNSFPAVSNLTKVTTCAYAWNGCSGIKNGFPYVNTLTNVTDISAAWSGCSGNTNEFPAVSNLINVTTLKRTWYLTYGSTIKYPEVSALTNVTSLEETWYHVTGLANTNDFPAVSNLTKVTTMLRAWRGCNGSYFSVQSVLGDCLWITGQVKNVSQAFQDNIRMTGQGMPLVTAITNSPGYPTGYTITDCFQNCTNLSDWADIPAAFK